MPYKILAASRYYQTTNEPLLVRPTSRLDRSEWIRNHDHVDVGITTRITLAVQPDNFARMPEPEEQLV